MHAETGDPGNHLETARARVVSGSGLTSLTRRMAREKLTQKGAAERLDLDVRQIRNLEKKPGFPITWKRDEKTYPWPEVLHWYLAFKADAANAKFAGPVRLLQAEIRDKEARAAKTELALARANAGSCSNAPPSAASVSRPGGSSATSTAPGRRGG